MKIEIVNADESHIKKVIDLYKRQEHIDIDFQTLKWLNYDKDQKKYNSLVAVDEDDNVVGHIGYDISHFNCESSIYKGVITNYWIADKNINYPIGLLLRKKVNKLSDFQYEFEGSQDSRDIFPLMKYEEAFNINAYEKPINICKSIQKVYHKKGTILKKLYRIFKYLKKIYIFRKNIVISMKRYDLDISELKSEFKEYIADKNYIYNKDESKILDKWAECKEIETKSYMVKKGSDLLGYFILGFDTKKGVKSCRVIHISNFGEDMDVWSGVLDYIINILKGTNVATLGVLSTHPSLIRTLEKSGFFVVGQKLFWLKDKNKYLSRDPKKWHVTFTEGDIGYRGF